MKKQTPTDTSKLTNPAVAALLAFVCCFLWGSAIPMIKTGYSLIGIENSQTASQILFAGARFTIAGILVIVFGSIMSKKPLLPEKSTLKYAPVLCIFQTIGQYFFFYIGVAHTTGVTGSILNATGTFFSILIACLIFRQEKLAFNKLFGCLIGFIGVLLINISGSDTVFGFSFLGEGFMVISTLMSAMSSVLIKDFSQKENPVRLSGYQFFLGGIVLIIIGLCMGGHLDNITSGSGLISSVGVLLYLAFVSAMAYTLWSLLLKHNPVSRIAVFGFMNPVCGVFLSAFILGETKQAFRLNSLFSLILVSLGIYIVNHSKNKSS